MRDHSKLPQAPIIRNPTQRASHTAPPNWPTSLKFLPHPVPHSSLPKELIPRYCSPVPPPTVHRSPLTKITKITDSSHPAHNQYGLFATKKIPPRTWIIDYTGVVHDQSGTDSTSNYDLCLELLPVLPAADNPSSPPYYDVAIDAGPGGNAARFINDYRGIPGKTKPNVEFQSREVEVTTPKDKVKALRMGIWSGKDGIAKGEELLLSYGRAFWRARRREEEDDKMSNDASQMPI